MKRLIAATALALVASSAHAADWSYHEERDPIDDTLTSGAILKTEDADLTVMCSEGRTLGVLFTAPKYLSSRDYGPLVYRFDDGVIHERRWFRTKRTALASGEEALRFVTGLNGGRKVAIRAKSYDGTTVTREFDLTGDNSPVSRVLAACGRAPLEPRAASTEPKERI
ncbi:hypothetical protein ACFODL_15630 [Phenylobacterium terrae]|uniref:Uncharacterized protein n=1 Tax=Phenylobacterium terrae TaxID=2665495 RepID=A0ABW4N7A1_9CAUL